eukprot:15483404-Alexandrium_andersonii.AAC.1
MAAHFTAWLRARIEIIDYLHARMAGQHARAVPDAAAGAMSIVERAAGPAGRVHRAEHAVVSAEWLEAGYKLLQEADFAYPRDYL